MASGKVRFLFGWYNLSGVFSRSWEDESIFDSRPQVESNDDFLVSFFCLCFESSKEMSHCFGSFCLVVWKVLVGWFRAVLFEKCSGSDGFLGRAELSEVLWQDLQVLREGKRGSRVDHQLRLVVFCHELQGLIHPRWCRKMEGLNLMFGCFGGGFPLHYISLAYSLYRWGFLHFRCLKCLMIQSNRKYLLQ